MTTPPRAPHKIGSTSCLVQHDIHLARVETEGGRTQVVASAECERAGCAVNVERCARCARFARIETHEAGYVLLCRSGDETVSEADPGEPADCE